MNNDEMFDPTELRLLVAQLGVIARRQMNLTREMYQLMHLAGIPLTRKETARAMGRNVKTICHHENKALAKLRAMFDIHRVPDRSIASCSVRMKFNDKLKDIRGKRTKPREQ